MYQAVQINLNSIWNADYSIQNICIEMSILTGEIGGGDGIGGGKGG